MKYPLWELYFWSPEQKLPPFLCSPKRSTFQTRHAEHSGSLLLGKTEPQLPLSQPASEARGHIDSSRASLIVPEKHFNPFRPLLFAKIDLGPLCASQNPESSSLRAWLGAGKAGGKLLL